MHTCRIQTNWIIMFQTVANETVETIETVDAKEAKEDF